MNNAGKNMSKKDMSKATIQTRARVYLRSHDPSLGRSINSTPIEVIAGSTAGPELTGECGQYHTLAGNPVSHPSAYGKKGRMVYTASTRKITVGADWRETS